MTKEETKKAIEVMQAFIDGAEIEANYDNEWKSIDVLAWNWGLIDYRVKPQPQYVPYDDVSEVQKDKWVKNKVDSMMFSIGCIDFTEQRVRTNIGVWYSLKELFEKFEYEDGTPCGKLVSE